MYNRYEYFIKNGKYDIIPFIPIRENDSDIEEIYKLGTTRLDLLSYKYYNDSSLDWLILQANPKYGSMEFEIPDNSILRIPYPLEDVLMGLEIDIKNYINLNK